MGFRGRALLFVMRTVGLVAAWILAGLLRQVRRIVDRARLDARTISHQSRVRGSRPEVVIVGAGQAGLAIGYYLAGAGVPFIILEGAEELGHSWRSRWDSLRLFSPARYSGLPGLSFPGPPGALPTKDEVADYLNRYAKDFDLPIRLNSRVNSVRRADAGYAVQTAGETHEVPQVVIAIGAFQVPYVPSVSEGLAPEVFQIHSARYRNPDHIPPGEVLVVGAANSGCQIAEELAATRKVYLSAGTLVPMLPRGVLGLDVFWWSDRLGVFEVPNHTWVGKRAATKDFVVATSARRLARRGVVELLGRAVRAEGGVIRFSDGRDLEVANVVWATGFRNDFSFIDLPVFDERGMPIHERGVSESPGLYFIGLEWLYTRGSGLIGWVKRDAEFLAHQIAARATREGD